MEQTLREKFIAKLEERYGPWDKMTSQFGSSPFGVISKDLSISSSQFSKLIYGTATEGMYQRSIENINRLIQRESIRQKLDQTLEENASLKSYVAQLSKGRQNKVFQILLFSVLSLGLGLIGMYFFYPKEVPEKVSIALEEHPLKNYFDQDFEANFDSPYLDISEVQEFCPASAYEGVWSLDKPYKLPLPGYKRPGLYYYAKSADVRMKCSRYDTLNIGKGRVLHAFEYLVNEIWLDTKLTPVSPRYFDQKRKQFTPEFQSLNFEEQPQFQKVATIHSFFTDKIEIYPDSIVRKGEPCGRFASDVNQDLVAEYEIDIKYILENVLGNLTTTACTATSNPFKNPNDLKEKESVISFDCIYTIEAENLGIGGGYPYQKGFILKKQNYADNLICD